VLSCEGITLELSTENLVVIISVGVTAGWLGYIVRGTGFGLLSDFAIGIVGALVGDWLLPRFGDGIGAVITNAAIGAPGAHHQVRVRRDGLARRLEMGLAETLARALVN
jgi:uncharacterized membrane protein YeaQ/YmgE (transglycosylase-associated protein family)